MNRWKVSLGGSRVIKLTPQDTAKAASSSRVQLFFLTFNPGKMMLVPDSSQPVKAGNWGSMNALTSRRFIEKDIKE
jgi:hypothetical protein